MHIPQELLKELPKKKKQQPNGIEACSLKSAIKKSHIVLKYNQKTGQIRPVVKSKSTTAKSTKSVDDVWKKFIEKGRKGIRAVTYRQWCEDNNRSFKEPVEFSSKNGPVLKVVEEFSVTGLVAWYDVGFATEENKKMYSKVW